MPFLGTQCDWQLGLLDLQGSVQQSGVFIDTVEKTLISCVVCPTEYLYAGVAEFLLHLVGHVQPELVYIVGETGFHMRAWCCVGGDSFFGGSAMAVWVCMISGRVGRPPFALCYKIPIADDDRKGDEVVDKVEGLGTLGHLDA